MRLIQTHSGAFVCVCFSLRYFFMRLYLKKVYGVYRVLQAIGYWCPLVVLATYGLGKLVQARLLLTVQQVSKFRDFLACFQV